MLYGLKRFSLLLFSVLFFAEFVVAQQTFYDANTIGKVEVYFSQSNWDYMMDTAKHGAEDYIMADSIRLNGTLFQNAGVKYKGNSSYDSTYVKNPLHIELDSYINQSYQGFTDIKLSNGYGDPSMIREVLSYHILKNYMHCPRANFAQLYINENYIGLYSNAESINKEFCSQHFYSSQNTFIKCNPTIIPGPTTKSNLRYLSSDSSVYANMYEIKSDNGWNELVALCDSVTNHASGLAAIMDMDRVIWMLAFNNVLVNLDSYSGVFCQNHYLYKDHFGFFNPVVWDLNMSLGGFPFAGSGAASMGSLTIANMQQLPVNLHATDTYWPLINAVMNNATYKRMYVAHMRTITNEFFANGLYQTQAATLQALIDTATQADTNKFFTYTDFQSGLTADVVFGSYSVPGISSLMSARVNFLQATSDFTASPPSIMSVTPSNSAPAMNTSVSITAQVTNTNTNAVWLGYRFHVSEKFQKTLMYDDGLHNDGAAGDNVYGALFTVLSAQSQYYIYAENNNAGIFSPGRAEHEYHVLNTNLTTAAPGQVVMNEFLAFNVNDSLNELGQHQDWIELYNTTSSPLDLFGLYLTDDFLNPQKFAFPENTVIPANGYRIIWADENNSTPSYVHCNFRLSSAGEQLMLSNSAGTVLDSITFGTQVPDTSFARCPNGTGNFGFQVPTFNAANCPVGINEMEYASMNYAVYPNPAANQFTISNSQFAIEKVEIYDIVGKRIFSQQQTTNDKPQTVSIDVSQLNSGLYLLKLNNQTIHKVQIIH